MIFSMHGSGTTSVIIFDFTREDEEYSKLVAIIFV